MVSEVYNMDCVQFMKHYPDKFFDLAVVDPPYGIGMHQQIGKKKGEKGNKWVGGTWDNETPSLEYFVELFRVSKNQIIWGGNYFELPPTRCFLIWDKVQRIDMADCEYAWTSFNTSARIYTFARSNIQGFRNPDRFHPTEKPIKLYDWIFTNYAEKGQRILDTHLGSQSSRIAAHKNGLDFYGAEIDKEYFDLGCKRYEEFAKQGNLFQVPDEGGQGKPSQKNNTLFDAA